MKFSVIVPVYNVAPYLRACLDSIVAAVAEMENAGGEKRWTREGCPLVEIVCVDDGSTDGSGAILDECREKVEKLGGVGQRMVVLHQKNAGVSAARNAALEVATGEWIMFVDADDCIQSNVFARVQAEIEKFKDTDLLSIQMRRFVSEMPKVDSGYSKSQIVNISRRIPYSVDEDDFFQFIYRKSLVADLRFPPYVMGEDQLFKTWVLVRACKLVQIDGIAYYYRCRAGSAVESAETWRKWRDDMCHSLRRLWDLFWCRKHVEWRIYRHQYGLMLRMLQRIHRVKFSD